MKITKSQLKRLIKEEFEKTVAETCGPAHEPAAIEAGPFQDQNVKVWELLTYMGLTEEQIDQVKYVLELNKAEAEVEDSFGIRLENQIKGKSQ